jgi:hypothetical protein
MDFKLLEENVCQGFRLCVDCRNSRKAREEFFRNGFVDTVDFPCPHGIPLSAETAESSGSETKRIDFPVPPVFAPLVPQTINTTSKSVPPEVVRAQDNMLKVADAVRKLRGVVTGEAVEWLNTIVETFFPRGLRVKALCVFQQPTQQRIKSSEGVSSNRILCCCPRFDSSKLFLAESDCSPEKCSHFCESVLDNMKQQESKDV